MYNLFSSRKEIHQIPFLFNPKSQIKHTSQPPLQLGGFWPVECGPKECIQGPSLATRNYWATPTLLLYTVLPISWQDADER